MADDLSIEPVTARPVDGPSNVDALRPIPNAAPVVPAAAAQNSVVTGAPNDESELDAATQRAQLLAGAISEPLELETASTIHNAALHGDAIAQAIEREHDQGTPQSQVLGGAAASAASGQSAQIQRTRPIDDEDDRIPRNDPLEPVRRLQDQTHDEAQQRRGELLEQELDES